MTGLSRGRRRFCNWIHRQQERGTDESLHKSCGRTARLGPLFRLILYLIWYTSRLIAEFDNKNSNTGLVTKSTLRLNYSKFDGKIIFIRSRLLDSVYEDRVALYEVYQESHEFRMICWLWRMLRRRVYFRSGLSNNREVLKITFLFGRQEIGFKQKSKSQYLLSHEMH